MRQAEFERIHSSEEQGSSHERFLALARSRFGRDLVGLGDASSSIEEFGRGIQALPQTDGVEPRQVFHLGLAGAGRVLLLPGLHGSAATRALLVNLHWEQEQYLDRSVDTRALSPGLSGRYTATPIIFSTSR